MTTRDMPAAAPAGQYARGGGIGGAAKRLTTETKQFFKTSEWWTYLAILIAILVAGHSIQGEGAGADIFAADEVWLYVTILTVGYLLSRGIAKAGARDPYWDSSNGGGGDRTPITERMRAAADVLRDGEGSHQDRNR